MFAPAIEILFLLTSSFRNQSFIYPEKLNILFNIKFIEKFDFVSSSLQCGSYTSMNFENNKWIIKCSLVN